MREILFRGKRKDNDEWVEGYLCRKYFAELPHDRCVIQYETTGNECEWTPKYMTAEVIPETIGQFTGLTDKNSKKIFEGDYWIDTDDDNLVLVVEFRNGQFCFVSYGWNGALMPYGYDETAGGFGECDCEPMTNYYVEQIEIIGNIHDNPELLKEMG